MRRLFWLLTGICILAGCQHPPDDRGIDVDVYPVTYQLSLVMTKDKLSEAEHLWQLFYARHHDYILSSHIDFYYQSETGKKLARLWRQQLSEHGAVAGKLRLHQASDLKPFDLQIRLLTWKAVTPLCFPVRIGGVDHRPSGCFVDGAIWQSAVHPENALPEQSH